MPDSNPDAVKTYALRRENRRKVQFNARLDDDVTDWIFSEAKRRNVSQSVVLMELIRAAIRKRDHD